MLLFTFARKPTTMRTLIFSELRLLFLLSLTILCGAASGAAQTDSLHDSAQPVASASVHEAPSIAPAFSLPQQPGSAPLERNLFWSAWWACNAAFAADFTTTGMVLYRGGHEADPLYTLFGNKNMAGVIGSAVVFRAVTSIVSIGLCKTARKRHGAWRFLLNAAATGLNVYFTGVYICGAVNNIGVYKDLKK
jgi:hypothetical protein